jgi:hypothetical protein
MVIAASCSTSQAIDHRMSGEWVQKGGQRLLFSDGTIIRKQSGSSVYGDYRVLNDGSVRIQLNRNDDKATSFVVAVEFPTPSTMVWYRAYGAKKRIDREFVRPPTEASVAEFAKRLRKQFPEETSQFPNDAALVEQWLRTHPQDRQFLQFR